MFGSVLALAYMAVITVLSPAILLLACLWPFHRRAWAERWGFGLPDVEPGGVWLHAASLGEGRAADALAASITASHENLPLFRTATSVAARDQSVGVDGVAFAPVDVPWVMGRFLRKLRPRLLILVESELWPCWLWACRKRTPVAVISARIGPGTRRWARICPPLLRWMLRQVTIWTAQSAEDAEFLEGFLDQTVLVSGDLKRDAPIGISDLSWSGEAFVAACTYGPSEAVLLDAWVDDPSLPLLILAPRQPSRFAEVAAAVSQSGLAWVRRSELPEARVPGDTRVLLLDSMGELGALYERARGAFIGGTFSPDLGGHSATEANVTGTPVVYGPETSSNQASFDAANGLQVSGLSSLMAGVRRVLDMRRKASDQPTGACEPAGVAIAQLRVLLDAPMPRERFLRPWALPLVPLWRLGHWVHCRVRTPRRGVLPVIAVGGVTAGGSGKTPVALWLAERLAEQGHRPALLARGYGREGRESGPRLAFAGKDARNSAHLGDELTLAHERGLISVSCPDRYEGLFWAQKAGATIAVLDDGLQQRRLVADARVLVLDGRGPTGGGLIPAGIGRVRLRDVCSPDVLWCQHEGVPDSVTKPLGGRVVCGRITPVSWVVDGEVQPIDWRPSRPVVVLTGIAHPGSVYRLLRGLGIRWTSTQVFQDHHRFSSKELADLRELAVHSRLITTEKDAVRLPADLPIASLRIDVDPQSAEQWLRRWLADRWPVE